MDAAAVASAFNLDPVAVLKGTWREWHVRLAAVELQAEAIEQAKDRK